MSKIPKSVPPIFPTWFILILTLEIAALVAGTLRFFGVV